MEWIKRNLVLVISGVVSLVVIGAAGFYLYSRWSANADKTAEFEAKKQAYQALLSKDPYPSKENLEAIKKAEESASAILKEFNQFFAPVEVPAIKTPGEFKAFLEESIYALSQKAASSSITIPTNYNFSFSAQRSLMTFDTNLTSVAEELVHVTTLCSILFDSRISELVRIRRAPVTTNDTGALGTYPSDYLGNRQAKTNEYAFVLPYELVFKSSSAELGTILDRLARATNGFLVKMVKVEPAESATEDVMGAEISESNMSSAAAMASRYGRFMGRRQTRQVAAAPEATQTASTRPKGPEVLLKEKALRIVLLVDIVRLK
jgi:hypothetical protein